MDQTEEMLAAVLMLRPGFNKLSSLDPAMRIAQSKLEIYLKSGHIPGSDFRD